MTLAVPPGAAGSTPERSDASRVEETVDPSVGQAVERLRGEYAGRVGPQLLVRVVRDCRRELGGSPVGALPELVERLARYRLDRHIG
ncbi:three-helix bundle dimerization domain-containing protein [Blastococcus sp. SYSU DS0539]